VPKVGLIIAGWDGESEVMLNSSAAVNPTGRTIAVIGLTRMVLLAIRLLAAEKL
jgi:hypothetical protein